MASIVVKTGRSSSSMIDAMDVGLDLRSRSLSRSSLSISISSRPELESRVDDGSRCSSTRCGNPRLAIDDLEPSILDLDGIDSRGKSEEVGEEPGGGAGAGREAREEKAGLTGWGRRG
jgi:hypothetical protein